MFDTLIKFDKNREKLDFYATDQRAIKELLKIETFREHIYEPACGQWHIGKILEEYGYKVKATDICYRGYGEEREVDFFTVKENALDIITNPPYFCAEGQKRYKLFKKYPPKRVYVFAKRLNCAKNGEFEKYKSSAIAFAWFIWEVGYAGKTELKWIE